MAAGPSPNTDTSSSGPKLAFHHELLAQVGKVRFFFYKVTTTFNPTSTLSKVDLVLEPFANPHGNYIVAEAEQLFAFDRLEAKPEYAQAFKYIKNYTSKPCHHTV